MSNRGAPTVSEVLAEYVARRKLGRRLEQASAVNDWEQLVGVQVASVTEPDSVDHDGTLRVRVQSPAWLQELQLMSPTIIKELARKGKPIKRIWWTLGTIGREFARENEGSPRTRGNSR